MELPATASTAFRLADDFSQADDDPPAHELAVLENIALDRHPVAVYLARLAPSSRRTILPPRSEPPAGCPFPFIPVLGSAK